MDRHDYCDVYQVPEGEAGYESVGSIPHAFVLGDNPQQGGVANDSHNKDRTGKHDIDVPEGCFHFHIN